ncbi:MAG: hypothetical protein ACK4TG_10920, partial [Thermaurantiacus sp.]
LDRIVRCSDLACRQLYVAGEARWAAEVLTAVSKQLRWVSHRLTVETKEEKEAAASAWAQLWPPVVQRDSAAADLAAQRMLMRAVYTVLPKFYRERGLDAAEAEARFRRFLAHLVPRVQLPAGSDRP